MLDAQHRYASWGQRRTPALQPPALQPALQPDEAPGLPRAASAPGLLRREPPCKAPQGRRGRTALARAAPKAMLPRQRSQPGAEATLRRSHGPHVALTSREVHTEATRGPRTGHAWTGAACSVAGDTETSALRGQVAMTAAVCNSASSRSWAGCRLSVSRRGSYFLTFTERSQWEVNADELELPDERRSPIRRLAREGPP